MELTAEEKAVIISNMDTAEKAAYDKLNDTEKNVKLQLIKKQQTDETSIYDLINSLNVPKTDTQSQGTSTVRDVLKLTPDSARLLLTQAAAAAQYAGKLNKKDISNFIEKFQAEASKQMTMAIQQAQESRKVGAAASDMVTSISDQVKQSFPSFFKAETFAKDYIWSKINFKDETSLGGNAITALSEARKAVSDMRLLGVSDAEVRVAAKQIARGDKTINDYISELQVIAKREYSHLANRYDADPTLTTRDIASPIINMLASVWEMDPKEINMEDPYVMSYIAPAGADGTGQPPSYADLYYKAMKDPKADATTKSVQNARQAATSLARAFGAGV